MATTITNEAKIPTYSTLGKEDVDYGALLGSGAYDLDRKVAEVTSFNIKSALQGNVKKTLDKLPSYIRYIEKEYDVAIYEKTKKKLETKKKNPYKRDTFRWQDYAWEVA